MKYKLLQLPPQQLKAHPSQSQFSAIAGEDWAVFAASVAKTGIIQPVVVGLVAAHEAETQEGAAQEYTIVSGHHRYQAALQHGYKTIPCLVGIYPDKAALNDAFFLSNQGRTLSLTDKYVMYQHMAAQEPDRRAEREHGEDGRFHHSAQNAPNGETRKRDRILGAIPEITSKDYTLFRAFDNLSPVERERILSLGGTKKQLFKEIKKVKEQRKELKAAKAELQARASTTANLVKREALLVNRERATFGTLEADQALKSLIQASNTMREATAKAHECISSAPARGSKLLDLSPEAQAEIRDYITSLEGSVQLFLQDMRGAYSCLFEAQAKREAEEEAKKYMNSPALQERETGMEE